MLETVLRQDGLKLAEARVRSGMKGHPKLHGCYARPSLARVLAVYNRR